MLRKKLSEKVPKNVFCIDTNIMPKKMRGKNTRNNFSRTTQIVRAKYVGTKFVSKCAKKRFLQSYECREKKGGKNREKFFPEHMNCIRKNVGKKIFGKKCETTFFIFTRISLQKWVGNNARNKFYRRTRIVPTKNFGKKLRRKKVRKMFFYIHPKVVTKKIGKKRAK